MTRITSLEDRILKAYDKISYVSILRQTETHGRRAIFQYFICTECDQKARWVEKIKHLETCITGAVLACEPKR